MIREYLFDVDPYDGLDLQGHIYNALSFNMPYSVLDQVRDLKPKLILEVGSWRGGSAIHMANQIKAENLDTEIVCIDTWLGAREMWTKPERDDYDRYTGLKLKHGYPSVYMDFLKNVTISGHKKRITPFPTTSQIGARTLAWMQVQADFIYIDASHDYEDVKSDMAVYWELLKPGGIMCGDDHNDYWTGVTTSVAEFSTQHDIKFEHYSQDDGWLLRKPQAATQ